MTYTFRKAEKVNQSALVMAYLKAHPGEWFTAQQIAEATEVRNLKIVYSTLYTYGCVGVIGKELPGKQHGAFRQRYCYQTRAGRAA